MIRCRQCNIQYVGETGNTLLTRFTQYRYNIGRKKKTHISLVKHFIEHGWSQLTALILQCDPYWSTAQRRPEERLCIHRLGTFIPGGLDGKWGLGASWQLMACAFNVAAFGVDISKISSLTLRPPDLNITNQTL